MRFVQSAPAVINTFMTSGRLQAEAAIRAVQPSCIPSTAIQTNNHHNRSITTSHIASRRISSTHIVGDVHVSSSRDQQLRHLLVTVPRSPDQSRVSALHPSVSKSTRHPSPPFLFPILAISSNNNKNLSYRIYKIDQPRILVQHPPDLPQVSISCSINELIHLRLVRLHFSSSTVLDSPLFVLSKSTFRFSQQRQPIISLPKLGPTSPTLGRSWNSDNPTTSSISSSSSRPAPLPFL